MDKPVFELSLSIPNMTKQTQSFFYFTTNANTITITITFEQLLADLYCVV